MGILGGNLRGTLKNRAIAVLAAGQSVGFILGLFSAGFLCSLERGWRYIFVLQAALGMVFVVMAAVSVPKDLIKYDRELDWLGVVLSTSGLVLFIFALSYVSILEVSIYVLICLPLPGSSHSQNVG